MKTLEKRIDASREAGTILKRNTMVKVKVQTPELIRLTDDLIRKRIREIAGKEKFVSIFQEQTNAKVLELKPNESCTSYLIRMEDPTIYVWSRNFCKRNSIQNPEEFLKVTFKHLDFWLSYYYEISDSPALVGKIIRIGKYVLEIYHNLQGIGGVVFTPEIRKLLETIKMKVGEIGKRETQYELYYWPLQTVSFENAMQKLKEAGLIRDISKAGEIFKNFENPGLTLQWGGRRRELIYFLVNLFRGRTYNSETLAEIGFKLFDFELKETVNAGKNFTTEVGEVEKRISFLHDKNPKYRIIRGIFTSADLN